jgi:flagellar biosynthetic protein FlhB
MAQESDQERTEQATPKRIREARDKGQIARSRELTTLSMLLVSGVGILLLGRRVVDGLLATLHNNLQLTKLDILDASKIPSYFLKEAINSLWTLAPLLLLLVMAAILAPMALGGWAFSAEAISFKIDRISPLKGIKRIFSWKSIIEIIKALAKFSLIATVACFFMWKLRDELIVLGDEDILVSISKAGDILVWAFIALSVPLLLVVAIDVPFQLWDHAKQLRMSRQEIRDENKETDGNPEIKGRVRFIQREMARKRMMAEIPRADVIITNPTHYAVALKYDQARMRAPVVVAKGMDLIALQIRGVGGIYKIPIVSSPALSRSIYHNTALNKEIPAGLYMAVAQILAYVYQLKAKGKANHQGDLKFEDVPIPDELQREV